MNRLSEDEIQRIFDEYVRPYVSLYCDEMHEHGIKCLVHDNDTAKDIHFLIREIRILKNEQEKILNIAGVT